MIQRIQSLYLLVASIISGGLIFLVSLWTSVKANLMVTDLFLSNTILEKMVPVFFLCSALLSIVTIFLFKNRQLQFVLCRLNILVYLVRKKPRFISVF